MDLLLAQPTKAELSVNATHFLCKVSSTSMPESHRPPMLYHWYYPNEDIGPVTDNTLAITNYDVNVSCAGQETNSPLRSPISDKYQFKYHTTCELFL